MSSGASPRTPHARALLIYNPKSGRGAAHLPEFIAALAARGFAVEARELLPGARLSALLSDAERFEAVVAAGGDGTVSAAAYALRYRNVPLLAYPAGTANLIAQNLELEPQPEALAELVASGRALALDLGELSVGGKVRGFAMLAGAGADAAMIRDAEDLKRRFGVMAYVVGAMRQLPPKATHFELELDGVRSQHEAVAVMAANLGMANYRLPIAPGISPCDGQLTVVLLKAERALHLLPHVLDSVSARLNWGLSLGKSAELYHARTVRVSALEPLPLQYDGELHAETTPFTARALPAAARFFTALSPEALKT